MGCGSIELDSGGKMDAAASRWSSCVLGHAAQELARLNRPGQIFALFTQLFEQAGIRLGVHILEVGSGAGDTSFLASELVGDCGTVVGGDRSEEAVAWANAPARFENVEQTSS